MLDTLYWKLFNHRIAWQMQSSVFFILIIKQYSDESVVGSLLFNLIKSFTSKSVTFSLLKLYFSSTGFLPVLSPSLLSPDSVLGVGLDFSQQRSICDKLPFKGPLHY